MQKNAVITRVHFLPELLAPLSYLYIIFMYVLNVTIWSSIIEALASTLKIFFIVLCSVIAIPSYARVSKSVEYKVWQ